MKKTTKRAVGAVCALSVGLSVFAPAVASAQPPEAATRGHLVQAIAGLTEADVRATITYAEARGLNTVELRSILAESQRDASVANLGSGTVSNPGQCSWKTKLAAWVLRHGGPILEKILSKLSPRAANWVRKLSRQLADFLDNLSQMQELPIATFLMSQGVPPSDAWNIARTIVLIIGI